MTRQTNQKPTRTIRFGMGLTKRPSVEEANGTLQKPPWFTLKVFHQKHRLDMREKPQTTLQTQSRQGDQDQEIPVQKGESRVCTEVKGKETMSGETKRQICMVILGADSRDEHVLPVKPGIQ